MSNPYSANAAALGYIYQVRVALSLLFKAVYDGNFTHELSIERLDDVAFEQGGSPQELIQTKHHIQAADLSDASADLWKTLRIWCEFEAANPGSTVTLTLLTTAVAVQGTVVEALKLGATPNLVGLSTRLTTLAQTGRNVALTKAYAAYLALSASQQVSLLKRITVLDGTIPIQDVPGDIKRRYLPLTVQPRHIDDLYERLEGWWCGKAVEMLSTDPARPLTVSAATLQAKVVSLGQLYTEANLPDDFPQQLEMDEEMLGAHERVFVAQLKLVLNNNTRLRHAIGQYYRAYNQRTRWLD